MDKFELRDQYPDLFQFFSFFVVGSYDKASTENIIDHYISVRGYTDQEATISQGKALLTINPFPWKAISDLANKYFPEKEIQARHWVASMIEILELKYKQSMS